MKSSGSGRNSATPLCEAANAASSAERREREVDRERPAGAAGEQLERAHAERGTLAQCRADEVERELADAARRQRTVRVRRVESTGRRAARGHEDERGRERVPGAAEQHEHSAPAAAHRRGTRAARRAALPPPPRAAPAPAAAGTASRRGRAGSRSASAAPDLELEPRRPPRRRRRAPSTIQAGRQRPGRPEHRQRERSQDEAARRRSE